jgi:peptidoglycan/LPS O-acetylase OafA/YrhL
LKLLSEAQAGRNNNFDIIRLVLSISVLVGHSFAIEPVAGWPVPLGDILKSTWLGGVGVDGFFIISGFLVTASAMKHDTLTFFLNRFLRVVPALLVCLAVTLLAMSFISSLGQQAYWTHPGTARFFVSNLTLTNMAAGLPGVLENTVTPIVNGSLWTLPVEVRLYILLGGVALFGALATRFTALLALATLAVIGYFNFGDLPTMVGMDSWRAVSVYFLAGSVFFLVKDWIRLSWRIGVLCLAVFLYAQGKPYYAAVAVVPLAYLLFCLAYLTPPVRIVQRIGDLSYGVYIYAWPTQRLLWWWFGPINPVLHALLALVITSALAYLSWRFIEKPALAWKGLGRTLQASFASSRLGRWHHEHRTKATARSEPVTGA